MLSTLCLAHRRCSVLAIAVVIYRINQEIYVQNAFQSWKGSLSSLFTLINFSYKVPKLDSAQAGTGQCSQDVLAFESGSVCVCEHR